MGKRTQREFALASGISATVLSQYLNSKSEPTRPVLVALANAANVSLEWLATGEGKMRPDSPTPRINDQEGRYPTFKLPANAGFEEKLEIFQQFTEAFRRQNPNPGSTISFDVVAGDSMEPTFSDGEVIAIDHSDTDPKKIINGVYAFRLGTLHQIARFQRLPGDLLKLTFDNDKYNPFTLDITKLPPDFVISGRVFWAGHKI